MICCNGDQEGAVGRVEGELVEGVEHAVGPEEDARPAVIRNNNIK